MGKEAVLEYRIRPEASAAGEAVRSLTTDAFASARHSRGNEAEIVDALRVAGALTVSLVAVSDGELIGHVAFSSVTIDGAACGWFGLGPVSVRQNVRGRGIGGALIRAGLQSLRSDGAAGCVVLGNPAYYRRFGFEADPAIRLEGVPPENFMLLSLDGSNARGVVAYHPAFFAS